MYCGQIKKTDLLRESCIIKRDCKILFIVLTCKMLHNWQFTFLHSFSSFVKYFQFFWGGKSVFLILKKLLIWQSSGKFNLQRLHIVNAGSLYFLIQVFKHLLETTKNLGRAKSYEMHLRDLVPSVQFKKREKHPWKSVTSAYNFTKTNTPPWVFSCFLNCTNATKSHNTSPMRLFF